MQLTEVGKAKFLRREKGGKRCGRGLVKESPHPAQTFDGGKSLLYPNARRGRVHRRLKWGRTFKSNLCKRGWGAFHRGGMEKKGQHTFVKSSAERNGDDQQHFDFDGGGEEATSEKTL